MRYRVRLVRELSQCVIYSVVVEAESATAAEKQAVDWAENDPLAGDMVLLAHGGTEVERLTAEGDWAVEAGTEVDDEERGWIRANERSGSSR